MCEFEGICIFEDCDECDKDNPEDCPNWVIMMAEVMEGQLYFGVFFSKG